MCSDALYAATCGFPQQVRAGPCLPGGHSTTWSRPTRHATAPSPRAWPACSTWLGHWLARFRPGDPAHAALAYVATETGWPRRSDRVLAAARATYLWLPAGTRLWQERTTYEPLDAAAMRDTFASVT